MKDAQILEIAAIKMAEKEVLDHLNPISEPLRGVIKKLCFDVFYGGGKAVRNKMQEREKIAIDALKHYGSPGLYMHPDGNEEALEALKKLGKL